MIREEKVKQKDKANLNWKSTRRRYWDNIGLTRNTPIGDNTVLMGYDKRHKNRKRHQCVKVAKKSTIINDYNVMIM